MQVDEGGDLLVLAAASAARKNGSVTPGDRWREQEVARRTPAAPESSEVGAGMSPVMVAWNPARMATAVAVCGLPLVMIAR